MSHRIPVPLQQNIIPLFGLVQMYIFSPWIVFLFRVNTMTSFSCLNYLSRNYVTDLILVFTLLFLSCVDNTLPSSPTYVFQPQRSFIPIFRFRLHFEGYKSCWCRSVKTKVVLNPIGSLSSKILLYLISRTFLSHTYEMTVSFGVYNRTTGSVDVLIVVPVFNVGDPWMEMTKREIV